MPKKLLRKYLPDPHKIMHSRSLSIFGTLLHDPNLWHMNRKSVSMAFLIGLFIMWIPFPAQMVIAAGAAIVIRCNIAISVALVWITNPLTMGPMYYFAYKLGNWMLGSPPRVLEFHTSIDWITEQMHHIWEPLLLGCTTLGIISGIAGFISIRVLWRLHIINYLKVKKLRFTQRKDKNQQS